MSFEEDKLALQSLLAAGKMEPFVRHIRFPKFKSLALDTRIDFTYPVTALVGMNGANKSSILRAIQGAPGNENLGVYWFSTSTDPIAETSGALARDIVIKALKRGGEAFTREILRHLHGIGADVVLPRWSRAVQNGLAPVVQNALRLAHDVPLGQFRRQLPSIPEIPGSAAQVEFVEVMHKASVCGVGAVGGAPILSPADHVFRKPGEIPEGIVAAQEFVGQTDAKRAVRFIAVRECGLRPLELFGCHLTQEQEIGVASGTTRFMTAT